MKAAEYSKTGNLPPSITMYRQQVNDQIINKVLDENQQHRNAEHNTLQELFVFQQFGIFRYLRLIHSPNQTAVQDQQNASDKTNEQEITATQTNWSAFGRALI